MNNKKITQLNSYSIDNTLENIRNYKRRKTVRRRLTAIVVVGLSLIVLVSIPIVRNLKLTNDFDAKAIELTEELETVENEKKTLGYEVALLEDDEYVAKLARKELNLSKVNEILINLPEAEDSEAEEGKTAKADGKED